MSVLTFPFQVLYGIPSGHLSTDLVTFPKSLFVERVVLEPCCQPPFDHPCAHVRLESAAMLRSSPPELFARRPGAWLSLREGKEFLPRRMACGVQITVFNLSAIEGRYLGGFVEALDVEEVKRSAGQR